MSSTASAFKSGTPASNVAGPIERSIRFASTEEHEQLLQLNLADLNVPKVNNLHIDGFKPSWFARLLGKR